ncbi:MAG: hypothetical protein HY200_01510 [Nitrospirae bacterium]|nr:hypothetical protein [Nitrospirota bacterium]
MKGKLSATIDKPLLKYLDTLPGESRSEKLEALILKFKKLDEERLLRKLLSQYQEDDDERTEREAWEQTMEEGIWSE